MEERYSLKRPASLKRRKRIGCGTSSGTGKTSGRGQKGQGSRSGNKRRAWFEGGQMPLQRRLPKRGFKNFTRVSYQVVRLSSIEKLGGGDINPVVLKQKGIIARADSPVKVLGNGDISKPVKVYADAFSKSAMEKIKKAGGEAIIREYPTKTKKEKAS